MVVGRGKKLVNPKSSDTKTIVNTILGAVLIAATAGIYEYVLSYNTGALTFTYQALLIFIVVALLGLVVVSKAGYVTQSSDVISLVFISLSVFLVSLFAHSLFVGGTPGTVMRHMGWVIAVVIIPF